MTSSTDLFSINFGITKSLTLTGWMAVRSYSRAYLTFWSSGEECGF